MSRLGKFFLQGLLVFCLCVSLIACSKVTEENFDKVQPGMTMQQVIAILGEPSQSQSVNFAGLSGTSAVWKDANREIDIQFFNNQVQIKSFNKINKNESGTLRR